MREARLQAPREESGRTGIGQAGRWRAVRRTRNLVNSSNIRLFFVASKASNDFPLCAFAFSAFGLGSCRPVVCECPSSSGSSSSSPANSTYCAEPACQKGWVLWDKDGGDLHDFELALDFVVVGVLPQLLFQSVNFSCLRALRLSVFLTSMS
jgi:hypothetical protein